MEIDRERVLAEIPSANILIYLPSMEDVYKNQTTYFIKGKYEIFDIRSFLNSDDTLINIKNACLLLKPDVFIMDKYYDIYIEKIYKNRRYFLQVLNARVTKTADERSVTALKEFVEAVVDSSIGGGAVSDSLALAQKDFQLKADAQKAQYESKILELEETITKKDTAITRLQNKIEKYDIKISGLEEIIRNNEKKIIELGKENTKLATEKLDLEFNQLNQNS
jgi:hypothetical protein